MTNATQDVIVRLLTNIGSKKEVEQYLRHYASVDAPKFAVVKVSGSVLEDSLDALVSSLTFLQRVGLVPIVVHGGARQISRALREAGLNEPLVDGLWAMTPKVLEIARRVLHENNHKLVEALEALGTRTRPFTSGVFQVDAEENPKLGLVGEVAHVRETALVSAAQAGYLPVLTPLGETDDGRVAVVHADVATRKLALTLKPHKVVFLSEAGGLIDAQGHVLPAVNLREDYTSLVNDEALPGESRRKLAEFATMLDQLPPTSSVSVTSPENLAKELFTHRGAGTLVRRGELVSSHESFDTVDIPRLRALLEECFGRKLKTGYFDDKKPHRIYLSDSYRATAILTLEFGVPYLDKFAVTPEAQGEGIGGSIWQRLRRETPRIFWRARASNPVNGWYAQNADGVIKSEKWWVFWCGLRDFKEIEQCVTRAFTMPATLKDGPPALEGALALANDLEASPS